MDYFTVLFVFPGIMIYICSVAIYYQWEMITEVRLYQVGFDTVPDEEDLLRCIGIAREHGCIVRLEWRLRWSGDHYIQVTGDSTVEGLLERMPKSYGM